MSKELKSPPLVEAILEIRWQLQKTPSGSYVDPNYRLLLARMFDKISKEYPEHEQLPTANFPDEMAVYNVQHRFRIAKNSWPLVQIGPGVFTVNSTTDYKWQDFHSRILFAIDSFYHAYPKIEDLKINNIILRYIDVVDFDYNKEDILAFLHNNFKLNISLPTNLFDKTNVKETPDNFIVRFSFNSETPKGIITLRFATGKRENTPALILETTIESDEKYFPQMTEDIEKWINEAHDLTNDWFFKIISGELERRFLDE